ncbi:PUA-like domain-containing protein [Armillaria borealis]|uniref:PUA-like domain-containing protein n=1 Tax=Armillaria borealis TaxID=47425 RepID=A0AA39MX59_9AGAR|nr:PUA-like domain-containing protein [Armillaria borealis]
MRIVKDYRNLEVDKPKEREGCRKPVADLGTVGEIEGQPVGTQYLDRTVLLETGVHGGLRRGIYSYKGSARSVILSDGYEEFNKDKGNRIRLCGEGGRSKDGKMQVKNQEYTHGNRALQKTMQLDQPVLVIQGYRLHSKYTPNNGFRYDGLYKVTVCYQKWDENGYKITLFKLERNPDQLLPIGIGTPLSPVKVENYCDDTLQYLVKAESPVIAASSIPLLQYPKADVKVAGTQECTHISAKPPLRAPLVRKR